MLDTDFLPLMPEPAQAELLINIVDVLSFVLLIQVRWLASSRESETGNQGL